MAFKCDYCGLLVVTPDTVFLDHIKDFHPDTREIEEYDY